MNKEGLIYCVKNPLFPHLVKIGKTTAETVEARGLNDSNVPEDFETIFAIKVSDIDATEKSVHRVLDEFRHRAKSGRSTEFFYACVAEKAKKQIEPFFIEDKTWETELEVETEEDIIETLECKYNDLVSWEELRLMRPKNDKFITEKDAKAGWIRATNPLRMAIVKVAKKDGAWKDARLSLGWLKTSGYYEKIMKIDWDDH
jgi:hypothetical protein